MKKLLFLFVVMFFLSCEKQEIIQEEQTPTPTFCWTCITRLNQTNYKCGTLESYTGSIPVVSRVSRCDMTASDARNYEASLGSFESGTVDATPCRNGKPLKTYTKEVVVTCTQQK